MSRTKSPRFLLLCFHSLRNAGDAALLEVTLNQLRQAFDHPRLQVCTNHPEEQRELARLGVEGIASPAALVGAGQGVSPPRQLLRLARLTTQRRWPGFPLEAQRLMEAAQQADVVFAFGGNPFFSMGRWGWPLYLSALELRLVMRRRPRLLIPQPSARLNAHGKARRCAGWCALPSACMCVMRSLSAWHRVGWGKRLKRAWNCCQTHLLTCPRLRAAPRCGFCSVMVWMCSAQWWGWRLYLP